jgi:hypothetical protein
MTNWMAREGARLVDNGYRILPVWPGEKAPALYSSGEWREMAEWTRYCARAPTDIEIDHWSSFPDCSVGIAGGNVVAIDIDVLDDRLSHRLDELARHVLGETPLLRYGRKPKRLLVYQAEQPFYTFRSGPLEILCLGRQFVGFGRHPAGMDYQWPIGHPSEITVDQLPKISESMARTFLEEGLKLLPPELRPTRARQGHAPTGAPKERATREAVAEALAFIVNPGRDYDFWLLIGMAIHEALASDGLDLWHDWSSRSPLYDAALLDKKWPTFGRYGGDKAGAGTLFDEARRGGWTPSPGLILNARDVEIADAVLVDFSAIISAHAPAPEPTSNDVTLVCAPPVSAAPEPRWSVPAGLPAWRRGLTGGLKLFVDHADATAISPQPWVALGAALATFGCIAGRRYASPTGLRTNLYCVGIAGSGGGKDHPLRCSSNLLAAADLDQMVGGAKIASGAAILTALERQPSSIFLTDEIGFLMQAVADRKRASRHEAEIIGNMTELYSAAQGTFYGTAYANQKEKPRTTIHEPNLCVFGVTTPQVFWSALSSAHVQDGSLARFLIFETDNPYPDPRDDVFSRTLPGELVMIAKAVAKGADGHDAFPSGPTMQPKPFQVPYADAAATARAREISLYQTQLLRERAGTSSEPVLARIRENSFKLALIRAVSDRPGTPAITVEDLEWGFDIADASARTILQAVEERVADTPAEAELKRLLRLIRDAGAPGISKSELTKKTQWLSGAKRRDEILVDLVESGDVRSDVIRTGGAPKAIFYAN